MKTITRISMTLFLSLSMAMVSCGDDDGGSTNNNDDNPSGEFMKAKVDGQDFSSSTSFDAIAASNPNATTLVVQGSNNSGHAIQLMVMNFNGVGTYNVSEVTAGQLMYTVASPFASYSSSAGGGANGEIEITMIDDEKVEGTFSFTGKKVEEGSTETKNVTDGEFRANLQ